MKIFTKLILTTVILSAIGYADDTVEKDYDLVLQKGGTIASGSILTMNGSNIHTLETLKVLGTIAGTGTIDGHVELDKGQGKTSFVEATEEEKAQVIEQMEMNQNPIEIGDDGKIFILSPTEGSGTSGVIEDGVEVSDLNEIGDGEYDLSKLFEMTSGDYAWMCAPESNQTCLIEGGTESKEIKANLINPEGLYGDLDFSSSGFSKIQIVKKVQLSGADSKLVSNRPFIVGTADDTATTLKTVTLPNMTTVIYPNAEMILSNADKKYEFGKGTTVFSGGKLTIQGEFNLLNRTELKLGVKKLTGSLDPLRLPLFVVAPQSKTPSISLEIPKVNKIGRDLEFHTSEDTSWTDNFSDITITGDKLTLSNIPSLRDNGMYSENFSVSVLSTVTMPSQKTVCDGLVFGKLLDLSKIYITPYYSDGVYSYSKSGETYTKRCNSPVVPPDIDYTHASDTAPFILTLSENAQFSRAITSGKLNGDEPEKTMSHAGIAGFIDKRSIEFRAYYLEEDALKIGGYYYLSIAPGWVLEGNTTDGLFAENGSSDNPDLINAIITTLSDSENTWKTLEASGMTLAS